MKKYLLFMACAASCVTLWGQSAMDGFNLSQTDLKGTARFMSMGGAFGALGGDLSTLGQNPAGIGVYRSSDLGFTLDLDCQSSKSTVSPFVSKDSQTKFYLNNIGYVGTFRVSSSAFLNFGFTFNKTASFNRRYNGYFGQLQSSLSNYIAGISNSNGVTEQDLKASGGYDPYDPPYGQYAAPWISILGYDSYLINPTYPNGEENQTNWKGQWGNGTSGKGFFSVEEKGSVDEYNISIGGSVNNVFFWGMDFGITDISYASNTMWGENLSGAYVPRSENSAALKQGAADWSLYNSYQAKGTGFNYKLGFIVKPIQELRLGFAFHTPTWYSIDESYIGQIDYTYPDSNIRPGTAYTNNRYTGVNSYNFRTPWRIIASAAGVIGSKFIVSADYEWSGYQGMHFSDNSDSYYYSWEDPYGYVNGDVKNYYQHQNSIRIGAEYRVTDKFSVRTGYCYVSSPVKETVKSGDETIFISGTRPSYSFNNETNYATCGIGYHYKGFYADAAYVWKHRSIEYHAYPADSMSDIQSPKADVTLTNSQVVLSLGFRF